MIRILILLLTAGLAAPSFASTTWDLTEESSKGYVVATCTTGTESAPTLITEGLDLDRVKGLTVSYEAAGAITISGVLKAYLWNPISEQWNRAPDIDLTATTADVDQEWGLEVVGHPPGSRIAFVPVGIGVAGSLYIRGGKRR